jgi:hypothetical protein
MKERRGMRGRATEIAESVVAGVKRRQQARTPKVLLYDDDGRPRTLDAGSPAAERLLDTAVQMVALAGPVEPDAGPDPLDGDTA